MGEEVCIGKQPQPSGSPYKRTTDAHEGVCTSAPVSSDVMRLLSFLNSVEALWLDGEGASLNGEYQVSPSTLVKLLMYDHLAMSDGGDSASDHQLLAVSNWYDQQKSSAC